MQTLDEVQPELPTSAPAAKPPVAARLLVVMAEVPIANLVEGLLSDAGYRVTVATPDEYPRAIADAGFDVAVVDETDAIARDAELVRGLAAHGRVVVLAGYGEPLTALELLRAGASEYLVMPLEGPECFLACVAALAAGSGSAGPGTGGSNPSRSRLDRIDAERLPTAIQEALVVLRGAVVATVNG